MEDANEQVWDFKREEEKRFDWILELLRMFFALLDLCFSFSQNPNDISYVYSGYAPLSIRLTQVLARPGWRSIEEVLKMLPGPHFEERQQLPAGLHKKRKHQYKRALLFALLLAEQPPACSM